MSIAYAVELANPHAHLFRVTLTITNPMPDEQLLMLPTWIPGSYMIRDMAADIVDIRATLGGRVAVLTKIDKTTWRVATEDASKTLCVEYDVFAKDLSVRLAYFDMDRAFFNPTSLCLCPIGLESQPMTIDIKPGNYDLTQKWKVATALTPTNAKKRWKYGTFEAQNYDELADSPFEVADFDVLSFKAGGAEHHIVLSGHRLPFDEKRLVSDVKKNCEVTIALFEPKTRKAPFKDYVFFLNLDDHLYGGLEHRASTALIASYYDLPQKETGKDDVGYQHLVGLFTHEYFHAWWVKRVKPAAFVPYDYHDENYTRLLWVFEGFTSYYDDVLLMRTQTITKEAFAKGIEKVLNRHLWAAGHLHQSLSESSFDAWTKYYKTIVNRQNSVTSYYDKGALVALALDSRIKEKTKGEKSLDDVLRFAWEQYKDAGSDYAGLDEDVMEELIFDATGVNVGEELAKWVDACQEPDWKKAFAGLGMTVAKKQNDILGTQGLAVKGVETVKVTTVIENSTAQKAGLSEGDWVVAIEDVHVTSANLEKLLKAYVGKEVDVHVIRNELLKKLELKVKAPSKDTYELSFK